MNAEKQEKLSAIEVENGVVNPAFQIDENIDNFVQGQNVLKFSADPNEVKKEKRLIWKSLICLCVSVTLGFSASITLIDSITSLYPNGDLGMSVLTAAGTAQVVSAAFFVPVSVKLWGCLKIVRVSLIFNFFFVVTFFYPNWITLIIGAISFGCGVSLLFTAGFFYANSVGFWLTEVTNSNKNLDATLVRVSGIMNASLGGGFVWGNLLMYVVLGPPPDIDLNSPQELCGAAYCNEDLNLTTLEPPSQERYYTLIGILSVMSFIACGLSYFLDDFSAKLGQVCCTRKEICSILLKICKLFKNPNGFLLVPLTFAIALEEACMVGDVTKTLIGCSLGLSMVGLLMMAFGVTQLVVSLGQWPFVKKCGRPFSVGIAVCVLIIAILTMLFWKPNPHQLFVYFVLICMWAAADAIIISVTFATYGAVFEENMDAGFAAAGFFLSCGMMFWFVLSSYICLYIKYYFLIAVFCISFVLYLILEKCVIGRQKRKADS